MKLVHLVLGKANPERANGVNRVAHGLATAQAHLGVDVEIWGITPTPAAPTPAREYGLRLFQRTRAPWALAPELVLALETLPRASLVHLHGGYHPEFRAAARHLAARDLPWVLTPHGAFREAVVRSSWLKKRLYLALVDGPLLAGARSVHVFSTRERDELLRYAPHARTLVIENGVDVEHIEYVDRPRAAHEPLVFGFCGRLQSHTKGLDLLLDAFAEHARAPDAHGASELRLIGDGRDEAALKRRASELGVGERVRFLGALFGAQKDAALAACDVFVHPSRHEGMPISVLEAAASGLPCLLSDETNLADAFDEAGAGWKLARNDVAHLARALTRCVARRDELPGFGQRARTLVETRFDWSSIAERSFAALYGVALSKAASAA